MARGYNRLPLAAALLAAATSASAAGGIVAGDWTLDIGGNVNAFYINNHSTGTSTVNGGLANGKAANGNNTSSINTGLLPSWLGVTGKTRQNDLDVEFAISFQPGASTTHALAGGGGTENRQAYISFGDKSWGTILIGKNLGEFGRDAILNDITLLGVGSQGVVGTAGGTTTTLGGIGAGYLYADFNGQINYTTPNFNGFQAVVGIEQPLVTLNLGNDAAVTTFTSGGSTTVAGVTRSLNATGAQTSPGFLAKGSYTFTGDVAGKVWAEVKTQNVDFSATKSAQATAYGIGATATMAGFGLTGYYYDGQGVGTTAFLMDGTAANGNQRDSNGGYVQLTYVLPTTTKIGVNYGTSRLDLASGEAATTLVKENEKWTVGAYHPLTKHLNLVAEYSNVKSTNQLNAENKSDIITAGAILFF